MIATLSVAALVGVAVVVALSATVQLSAGFGFGLAAVPLLSVVIDPHRAVVVALTLATLTNGYQSWTGRADRDGDVLRRLLVGAAVGLPVGLVVFRVVDDRPLGIVIGCAVLAAVFVVALGIDLRHAGPGVDLSAGFLAGALTMSSGVNGPPMVFVLQARHFDQARFRATITSVFFVLDVVSVAVFAATGEFDAEVASAVGASLPGLALGAAAGLVVRRHLDAVRFRRLVLALLTVAGISAIAAALAG